MTHYTPKILLIDDETSIAETIEAYVAKENMEMVYVANGEAGLQVFQKNNFDLIVLDWMLPGITGPEIIKQVREVSKIPILMLSARNDETDIVLGLELGADDYITKPFGPRELIARIHSLLRRSQTKAFENPDPKINDIKLNDITISFTKKEALKGNKIIDFTPKEFRILEELSQKKGEVIARETLMMKALGYRDFLSDRTLDTHIKNIRKKIEKDPKRPQILKTVREEGFRLITE